MTEPASQSGAEKFTTEVVLKGFNSTLVMLDGRNNSDDRSGSGAGSNRNNGAGARANDGYGSSSRSSYSTDPDLDDEVPF